MSPWAACFLCCVARRERDGQQQQQPTPPRIAPIVFDFADLDAQGAARPTRFSPSSSWHLTPARFRVPTLSSGFPFFFFSARGCERAGPTDGAGGFRNHVRRARTYRQRSSDSFPCSGGVVRSVRILTCNWGRRSAAKPRTSQVRARSESVSLRGKRKLPAHRLDTLTVYTNESEISDDRGGLFPSVSPSTRKSRKHADSSDRVRAGALHIAHYSMIRWSEIVRVSARSPCTFWA